MARRFHVLIEQDEDGGYVGRVPEIQGCLSQGDTLDELMENIKEAIELCLEAEAGRKHRAVELYAQKKVSIGPGAKLAGVSISEFLDLMAQHNISLNLTIEDVHAGLKVAEKILK